MFQIQFLIIWIFCFYRTVTKIIFQIILLWTTGKFFYKYRSNTSEKIIKITSYFENIMTNFIFNVERYLRIIIFTILIAKGFQTLPKLLRLKPIIFNFIWKISWLGLFNVSLHFVSINSKLFKIFSFARYFKLV